MNGLMGLGGTLAILLLIGGVIGLLTRRGFAPRWLLVAALLVAINDFCLTRFYSLLPDVIGGDWNWLGKLLALAVTLGLAASPIFGWRACGLTLKQAPGSLRAAVPVALLYVGFFVAVAFAFPAERATPETWAFQLTMPGLEEEAFYRGLLLLALDRAFTGRKRMLGVDWGWGAVLSCILFGLGHAFGYNDGGFGFDPATMLMTALPAFIAVWLRLRTGSLLLPVLLHNFGNAVTLA